MTAATLPAEQAGFQQQGAGPEAVLQIEQQILFAPTAFLQMMLRVHRLGLHQLHRCLGLEARQLATGQPQGLIHGAGIPIDAGHLPAALPPDLRWGRACGVPGYLAYRP